MDKVGRGGRLHGSAFDHHVLDDFSSRSSTSSPARAMTRCSCNSLFYRQPHAGVALDQTFQGDLLARVMKAVAIPPQVVDDLISS